MKKQFLKLLPGVVLTLLFCQSCSKITNAPTPIPFPIQSLEQTPFHYYMDSLFALANENIILTISAVAIDDVLTKAGSTGTGQAEIAYPFHSTTAGAITSLGIMLPSKGFSHTVTLWDAASQQVLAQANVPSLDSGKFTYVSLALANQAVVIQPNHEYIVGFNSLAIGNSLNTASPGNGIYILDGIYDFSNPQNSSKLPILPFTVGPITFEGYYVFNYDTPISLPPFPGSGFLNIYSAFDVPGVCDIGFIPQQ